MAATRSAVPILTQIAKVAMQPQMLTGAVAALGIAGAIGFASVSVVPAGHVGVVDVFGKVRDETLQPGFHILNPFAQVHKMSVKTQLMSVDARVPTKEGLTVELDTAVLYKLDPLRCVDLYKTVGKAYEEVVIRPTARATVRDLTSSYEAKALYTEQRTEIAVNMQATLAKRLKSRGVLIENTPLRKIKLPRSLSEAIQSKLEMEQQSQRMEFVLKRERAEAERKEIEATGIARFQEIVTQGINEGVLRWKAIEATEKLAESPNSKLVFIGNPKDGLPIMMGAPSGSTPDDWARTLKKLGKEATAEAHRRNEHRW